MIIHLISVGKKMPSWVTMAYEDYAKRLPRSCALRLIEVDLPKRTKTSSIDQLKSQEASSLLAAIPKNSVVIALDERGKLIRTAQLAEKLDHWQASGQDVSLLIGGPDGLAQTCLDAAHEQLALSPLTLPHPLCRVILAEQIYRAWSILAHHPYHRD